MGGCRILYTSRRFDVHLGQRLCKLRDKSLGEGVDNGDRKGSFHFTYSV